MYFTLKQAEQSYFTTDSQSVSSGVEPNLGLLTRDIYIFFLKLQSCLIWGALSDDRSGLSFVSLLSIQSVVVSVFTYIIYTLCYTHFTIKYNTIQLNIYIVIHIYNKLESNTICTIYTGLVQFRLCTAEYVLLTSK
jgi:hypothetical protein